MFESKTFETLLAQKLARVPKKLDKREGSIIYDALAPNAFETAMVYAAMDVVLDETFADTASRKYLVRRCAERGITPRPATVATAKGSFNIDVPIGSRFSCDKFNWIVREKSGSYRKNKSRQFLHGMRNCGVRTVATYRGSDPN